MGTGDKTHCWYGDLQLENARACLDAGGSAAHFNLLLSIPQFPARAEPGTVSLSNINKAGLIFLR